MNRFYEAFIIKPGHKVDLSRRNPDETFDFKDKEAALELLAKNNHRIARLQNDLYSEGKQSLLIVLQAPDAGGKDGTINNVFSAMNPQGCRVQSFKTPASSSRTTSSGASIRSCRAAAKSSFSTVRIMKPS